MKVTGVFEVVGKRAYRDHKPGTRFEASLDSRAASRAVQRGDIRLIKSTTPQLQPGSFRLPDNWTTP